MEKERFLSGIDQIPRGGVYPCPIFASFFEMTMTMMGILEKFWPFSQTVGEEGVEIMTVDWAALPNFFYLKTVIKLHWQNWPKPSISLIYGRLRLKATRLFYAICHVWKQSQPQPRCLSRPCFGKNPLDVSTSRHIVSELWLWRFMGACTLPNIFAVYKHFSSI